MPKSKKEIQALSKKDYKIIAEELNQSSYEDFLDILLHDNFEWSNQFSKHFWKTYIPNHKFFKRLFSEKYAVDFLKLYLKSGTNRNTELLRNIAELNPTALVTAIRLTKAFLRDVHFDSISFFENSHKSILHRNYIAFKALREKEQLLFHHAISHNLLKELTPIQWLFVVFIHYELRKRYAKTNKNSKFDHSVLHFKLIQTYNAFISYVLKEHGNEYGHNFKPSDIIRECRLLFEKGDFVKDIWDYIDILKDWRLWYEFVHDELDTYSYDLNFDVELLTNRVRFFPKDPVERAQRLASSIATAIFFDKWNTNALYLAPHFIEEMFNDNPREFSDPEKIIENSIGAGLFSVNFSKAFLLSFYYGIGAKDERQLAILLYILSSSQSAAALTYLKSIDEIRAENDLEWLFHLLELIFDRLHHNHDKFILSSFKLLTWDHKWRELIGLNVEEDGVHLFPLFDTNDKEVTPHYNRFSPFINLWQKPYLKFGNTVVYISTILADMDPAVLALECYLNRPSKNQEDTKAEVAEQERRFAETFREYGFDNVYGQFNLYTTFNGKKETIGEVDVLLYEGNEILLIELKRSRMPLTPNEMRCEQYEVLTHATDQLQKLITHIKAAPDCLLEKCNITEEQVKSARITGCVLNMYHHLDGTMLGESIVKTSFVSFFHNLKKCRVATGNKVTEFISNASLPFIDPKHMNLEPGKFDFEIPIS